MYPTLVIKGTRLASWFQKGKYRPLTLKKSIEQTKYLYTLFTKNNIRVIRMGLQASQDLDNSDNVLAGPYHPAFGHLVLSQIYLT